MNSPDIPLKRVNETRFLYFAAACAALTGFTTLAIHRIDVLSSRWFAMVGD